LPLQDHSRPAISA